jgi:hypothetical protein
MEQVAGASIPKAAVWRAGRSPLNECGSAIHPRAAESSDDCCGGGASSR